MYTLSNEQFNTQNQVTEPTRRPWYGWPHGHRSWDARRCRTRSSANASPCCTHASGLCGFSVIVSALRVAGRGEPLGAKVTINKPVIPKLAQDTGDLAMEICGYAGLVDDADTDVDIAKIHDTYFHVTAQRIAGGTDEIMRNQIAERVLGLPQEQRPDKGIPFDQLK